MEKKHAKHRAIPKAIINHPTYKAMKSFSKTPHRYEMWEESVVGGLHIFEWIVILLVGAVVFAAVYFAFDMNSASALQKPGWVWSTCCDLPKSSLQ